MLLDDDHLKVETCRREILFLIDYAVYWIEYPVSNFRSYHTCVQFFTEYDCTIIELSFQSAKNYIFL